MSDKFVYQNARVKCMESSLFTPQSVARLLDCTDVASAFRALVDMGFSNGGTVKDGDFDALFSNEEKRAAEFIFEFNVDGALDAFLAQYDFFNLKSLYKAMICGGNAVTLAGGLYGVERLKFWLEQDGKCDAPEFMTSVIAKLKSTTSPHKIDCIADKAAYEYAFSNARLKCVREYFAKKADVANISSYFRCKWLGLQKAYFEEGFINGGELSFLKDIYDDGAETLKEKCRYTEYRDSVNKLADGKNLVEFEVEWDDALLKFWKDKKDEMFDVAPIVAFYLTKLTQVRVAKLAVAGVKNGVDKQQIRQRMREIYA